MSEFLAVHLKSYFRLEIPDLSPCSVSVHQNIIIDDVINVDKRKALKMQKQWIFTQNGLICDLCKSDIEGKPGYDLPRMEDDQGRDN